MHELLAQWIVKYMDLEKKKGTDSGAIENLLAKYAKCWINLRTVAQSSAAAGVLNKRRKEEKGKQ